MTLLRRATLALAGRSDLFRDSLWGGFLRGADLFMGVVSLLILARTLRPEGLGHYALGMATMSLVGVVTVGLPMLCVREIAVSITREDWGRIRGLMRFSTLSILGVSLALAAAASGVVIALAPGMSGEQTAALLASLVLVPVFSLSDLVGSFTRAHGRVALGQTADLFLRPTLFVLSIGAAALFAPGWLTPVKALMLQVAGGLVALGVGFVIMRMTIRREIGTRAAVYEPAAWLKGAAPMSVARGLIVAQGNLPVMMLAIFVSAPAVGVFRIAQRAADMADLGFAAVSMAAAPRIAALYAGQRMDELKALLRRCSRASLLVASLILGGYALLYPRLVGVVFGQEYAAGYLACLIMTAAHAVDCYFGPNSVLLNMTGRERIVMGATGAGVGAEVLLGMGLIPVFGGLGAAGAVFAAFVVWNLVLSWFCRRRLNLRAEAFALRDL